MINSRRILSGLLSFFVTTLSVAPYAGAAPIQLGRSSITQAEDATIQKPDFHGQDPLGAPSPWFQAFHRDISTDPVDPHSDLFLARMRSLGGKIYMGGLSGPYTPPTYNWYTFPYQVVSGNNVPWSIVGQWSYTPDSGSYLIPPEPVVIEGSTGLSYYTSPPPAGDHHFLAYVRDEVTGGFKELWEYYQLRIDKDANGNPTHTYGASWRRFDLKNGENPPGDTSSTDAAGLPIAPLLLRYDEVATGSVNHVLRTTANNIDIAPNYKWPARTAAGAWGSYVGMPYGTILRIKKSWWDANADSVLGTNTQARVVGEALRHYGIMIADGTGGHDLDLEGQADLRWDMDFASRLSKIPLTALEVVGTPPMLEIAGPKALLTSQPGSWTMTVKPAENLIRSSNINLVTAESATQLKYMFATIDPAHRSVTSTWTFDKTGAYMIKPYPDWNTGPGPYFIAVTDTPAPPTSFVLLTSGGNYVPGSTIVVTATTAEPFTGTISLVGAGAGVATKIDLDFQNEVTRSNAFKVSAAGDFIITATNSQSLKNPSSALVTISDVSTTPASKYSLDLTGKGYVNQPVAVWVRVNRPFTGAITLTPNGCGLTMPVTLNYRNELLKSVSFIPTQSGTLMITGSAGGLATPSAASITVTDTGQPIASAYQLTGPTVGITHTATGPYALTPNGIFFGTIRLYVDDVAGILSQSIFTWNYESRTQVFTYTPSTTGTFNLTARADAGSLTDPASIAINVGSAGGGSPPGDNPSQNVRAFPNPITPEHPTMQFENVAADTAISIRDIRGRIIFTGQGNAWNGSDSKGQRVASGTYQAELKMMDGTTKKMKLSVVW